MTFSHKQDRALEALLTIAARSNRGVTNCFWCSHLVAADPGHNSCFDEFKQAIQSLFSAGRGLNKKQSIRVKSTK